MTDTESALLAAMLANPDDDNARHVLADWIEDSGDVKEANRIRWFLDHPEYRQSNPIRVAIPDWPHEDRGEAYPCCVVHRGFVSEVHLSSAAWLTHADELLVRHPVRRVRLTDGRWLDLPWPSMDVPRSGTEHVNDAGHWFYWYGDGPRYSLKALSDVLGIEPYIALRVNQAWDGYCRLRWPGIIFEMPPEPVWQSWRETPVTDYDDDPPTAVNLQAVFPNYGAAPDRR